MKKYTFYVGTFDKDTLKREKKFSEFKQVFDRVFEMYTLQQAQGRYIMQSNGKVISEPTFIITYFVNDEQVDLYRIADILKGELNQESILIEHNNIGELY
jgi:hypothetical protein|nr:MAG TPA: Protein of unknown function (DUF3574) [Caudoviricetes sp.]